MAVNYKVWNFPTFPISKQLFHVPGQVVEGGLTSGGARISASEPGGFGMLEIQPAFQTGEWSHPLSSWLMSKTNGEILRVRLAPTPQIARVQQAPSTNLDVNWSNEQPWSNDQPWSGDLVATYAVDVLQGTTKLYINTTSFGPILQLGHVIGHANETYLIDDITYEGPIAIMSVKPPLRRDVKTTDPVYFRPWFTGQILNGNDFRVPYEAVNVGNIQLGNIILHEVILP